MDKAISGNYEVVASVQNAMLYLTTNWNSRLYVGKNQYLSFYRPSLIKYPAAEYVTNNFRDGIEYINQNFITYQYEQNTSYLSCILPMLIALERPDIYADLSKFMEYGKTISAEILDNFLLYLNSSVSIGYIIHEPSEEFDEILKISRRIGPGIKIPGGNVKDPKFILYIFVNSGKFTSSIISETGAETINYPNKVIRPVSEVKYSIYPDTYWPELVMERNVPIVILDKRKWGREKRGVVPRGVVPRGVVQESPRDIVPRRVSLKSHVKKASRERIAPKQSPRKIVQEKERITQPKTHRQKEIQHLRSEYDKIPESDAVKKARRKLKPPPVPKFAKSI